MAARPFNCPPAETDLPVADFIASTLAPPTGADGVPFKHDSDQGSKDGAVREITDQEFEALEIGQELADQFLEGWTSRGEDAEDSVITCLSCECGGVGGFEVCSRKGCLKDLMVAHSLAHF